MFIWKKRFFMRNSASSVYIFLKVFYFCGSLVNSKKIYVTLGVKQVYETFSVKDFNFSRNKQILSSVGG